MTARDAALVETLYFAPAMLDAVNDILALMAMTVLDPPAFENYLSRLQPARA